MTTTSSTGPNLMDPALIADPYGGYNRLREEGPVLLGTRMDGGPAWYVTRQEDVRTVLSDTRFVNNAAAVPGVEAENARANMLEALGIPPELAKYLNNSILDVDGLDHTRLRKLVSRAFTVRRINALRPRVEEITTTLLDGFTDPVDLVAEFAYPLPITVISELVGVPEADRPSWRGWGNAMVSMKKERFAPAVQGMIEHSFDLIERRRAEPADDLITDLIRVQDEGGDQLTDDEMATMVLTLVMAGHETTAHLISAGAAALMNHPDQLALLHADPDLWPGAVHELMRWCGPVQVTRLRYAAEDIDIAGTRIHAGDAVQAVLISANHDPREYDDPERLDVTRRPSGRGEGHIGFGHGIHYCLGAALARQEGEVALRGLFDRYPNIALDTEELDWLPMPGIRRLVRLPVRLG
jgi:cytochrome P450